MLAAYTGRRTGSNANVSYLDTLTGGKPQIARPRVVCGIFGAAQLQRASY